MFSGISQIYRGTFYGKPSHHNDIISTVRHLKSLATRLFFQQLVETNYKNKAPPTDPL